MPSITKSKPYIPDSSHAESWVTPDTFVWNGRRYKINPNLKVRKLPRKNGK